MRFMMGVSALFSDRTLPAPANPLKTDSQNVICSFKSWVNFLFNVIKFLTNYPVLFTRYFYESFSSTSSARRRS